MVPDCVGGLDKAMSGWKGKLQVKTHGIPSRCGQKGKRDCFRCSVAEKGKKKLGNWVLRPGGSGEGL